MDPELASAQNPEWQTQECPLPQHQRETGCSEIKHMYCHKLGRLHVQFGGMATGRMRCKTDEMID